MSEYGCISACVKLYPPAENTIASFELRGDTVYERSFDIEEVERKCRWFK